MPTTSADLRLGFMTHEATTQIYTLSLHDALPIFTPATRSASVHGLSGIGLSNRTAALPSRTSTEPVWGAAAAGTAAPADRKSTRLNSSHSQISYAVFCLQKKKEHETSPSIMVCAG